MEARDRYKQGFRELRGKVGHEDDQEIDTLEARLLENLEQRARHGDTETLRHDRSRLLEAVNAVAVKITGLPFDDLCPQPSSSSRELHQYLEAVNRYCDAPSYLSLADLGVDPSKHIYVELRLREQVVAQPDGSTGQSRKSRPSDISSKPAAVLRTEQMLSVLGEPGAGKSTLLRHLARNAWTNPSAVGLDAAHVPVLLPLGKLARGEGSLASRARAVCASELSLTSDLSEEFWSLLFGSNESRLLLLFDGLDEIPDDQRAGFMSWFRGILRSAERWRVVITCRATAYRSNDLQGVSLSAYDVMPLTEEQIEQFADDCFPEAPKRFLSELERIRLGELGRTPLLLVIAARLFAAQGSLPARRSGLYDAFVDTWLAEANARGLARELGPRVSKLAKPILSQIAQFMFAHRSLALEHQVLKVVGEHLGQAIGLHPDEAAEDARSFLRVMNRRSGVFVVHGGTCSFIHPTFAEYLVAWQMVGQCQQTAALERTLTQYILEPEGTEIVRFAMGILSDRQLDTTELFQALARSIDLPTVLEGSGRRQWDGIAANWQMIVLAGALADGAMVEAPCRTWYIQLLERDIRLLRDSGLLGDIVGYEDDPLWALGSLGGRTALRALRAIAKNEAESWYIRFHAIRAMAHGDAFSPADLKWLVSVGRRGTADVATPRRGLLDDDDVRLDVSFLLLSAGHARVGGGILPFCW